MFTADSHSSGVESTRGYAWRSPFPGRVRRLAVATAVGVALLAAVAVLPAQAGARATTSTVVTHGLTFSEFEPEDICGPRASFIDWTIRTELIHVTEREDGSFSVNFNDTGMYHVDFVDPALADQESQFTESTHVTLTPGGTEVFTMTFHDFPTGIRILGQAHATVVDGRLIVERDILKVTGCP